MRVNRILRIKLRCLEPAFRIGYEPVIQDRIVCHKKISHDFPWLNQANHYFQDKKANEKTYPHEQDAVFYFPPVRGFRVDWFCHIVVILCCLLEAVLIIYAGPPTGACFVLHG
jgi:hypothetical protein